MEIFSIGLEFNKAKNPFQNIEHILKIVLMTSCSLGADHLTFERRVEDLRKKNPCTAFTVKRNTGQWKKKL